MPAKEYCIVTDGAKHVLVSDNQGLTLGQCDNLCWMDTNCSMFDYNSYTSQCDLYPAGMNTTDGGYGTCYYPTYSTKPSTSAAVCTHKPEKNIYNGTAVDLCPTLGFGDCLKNTNCEYNVCSPLKDIFG